MEQCIYRDMENKPRVAVASAGGSKNGDPQMTPTPDQGRQRQDQLSIGYRNRSAD